jgi:hypothetical protein
MAKPLHDAHAATVEAESARRVPGHVPNTAHGTACAPPWRKPNRRVAARLMRRWMSPVVEAQRQAEAERRRRTRELRAGRAQMRALGHQVEVEGAAR